MTRFVFFSKEAHHKKRVLLIRKTLKELEEDASPHLSGFFMVEKVPAELCYSVDGLLDYMEERACEVIEEQKRTWTSNMQEALVE